MVDAAPPWHQRVRRWGQTNLTEDAPLHYDAEFWRDRWRRSRVQGVIVNAGGIVAYYPSRFPHHYRARHLGDRDLFGEIVGAARGEGLAVLARMDSNRATTDFYREHPDWFGVNRDGEPLCAQGRHMACVNSPYYKEFIPDLLREIFEQYRPDGFTDNSWTGVGRKYICHCRHCRDKFAREEGGELPVAPNWDDATYRRWIRWSYRCRLENWDLNNRVTRALGGQDCLWLGMVHPDPITGHVNFADLAEIGRRTPILMTDQQSRTEAGFEQNSHAGKLLHEVSSWSANVPESMALYLRGPLGFRLAANPPAEARQWMISGIAGGLSPWWHIVGAGRDDRRRFDAADDLLAWHEKHEARLRDREPVATVGLLWSQANGDFYGRDDAHARTLTPYRGWAHALVHGRIPWLPIHATRIAEQSGRLRTLVLPDLRVLDPTQIDALEGFVAGGGSLAASGLPGSLDGDGLPANASRLEALLGVRFTGRRHGMDAAAPEDWEVNPSNSYLRLEHGTVHPALRGFGSTDILAFGGTLQEVEPAADAAVLATLIPGFTGYPPEFAWMRTPRTTLAATVVRDTGSGGRTVYLGADLDRCLHLRRLPDHARFLAGLIRWSAGDELPLEVTGDGLFDVHLYRQPGRLIVQIVNLTGCNVWPGYLEHPPLTLAVGVQLRLPPGACLREVEACVSGTIMNWSEPDPGVAAVTLPRLHEHEMLVFQFA